MDIDGEWTAALDIYEASDILHLITSTIKGNVSHWVQVEDKLKLLGTYKPHSENEPSCKCIHNTEAYATGTRTGYIELYDLSNNGRNQYHISSIQAHKYLPVTSIKSFKNQLYSVGKDCVVCIFSTVKMQLQLTEKIIISQFNNIRDLLICEQGLYVLGFNNCQCHLWSVQGCCELWSINCKGSNHPMQLEAIESTIYLSMAVKECLYYYNAKAVNEQSIGTDGHGKEILHCSVLEYNPNYIVTCSEDQQFKIWNSDLSVVYSSKAHIGSIRNILQVCINMEHYIISIGSKSQVTVYKISETKSMNLALIDSLYANTDSDNRLNCGITNLQDMKCQLVLGGSNGSIILIEFIENKLKLRESLDLCNVINVMVQFMTGVVLCGQTHGWLALVSYQHKLTLLHKQIIHDSAINSIQLHEHKIITCSDDQSIAIHIWDKSIFIKVYRVCNAHYSSIRCSYLLSNLLLTSSYDQSLSIWEMKEADMKLVMSCKHPIPDVSSLCIIEKEATKTIVIVGMGMCVIRLMGK